MKIIPRHDKETMTHLEGLVNKYFGQLPYLCLAKCRILRFMVCVKG